MDQMQRFFFLFLALGTSAALADQARVVEAEATASGGVWRFDVTISHPDTGWDHYANGWAVLDAEGNELGYRTLYHPHVDEQPFTRSLSGVQVPNGVDRVYIRADDSVHGPADELYEVILR